MQTVGVVCLLLLSRLFFGVDGKIKAINQDTALVCKFESEVILFANETKSCPSAFGDASQRFVIEKLKISKRCSENPKLQIIDVGGLYGDFGLFTASQRCHTTVYEPQPYYAHLISTSAALNPSFSSFVEVRNAGVSQAKTLRIQDSGRDRHQRKKNPGLVFVLPFTPSHAKADEAALAAKLEDKIAINRLDSKVDSLVIVPGETLDEQHAGQDILLLKVDVEGHEGAVLETSKRLFQEKRIKNLIFEFTPNQFANRGTDYRTILDDMYLKYSATSCFALHQSKRVMYKLNQEDNEVFYKFMHSLRFQLDIFCSFQSQAEVDENFKDVPLWTRPGETNKNVLW